MFSLSFTVLLELTAGVSVRLVAGDGWSVACGNYRGDGPEKNLPHWNYLQRLKWFTMRAYRFGRWKAVFKKLHLAEIGGRAPWPSRPLTTKQAPNSSTDQGGGKRRGYVRLSTARKHQFRGEADIAARTHFPSRHHWQFPRRNDRKTRVVSVTSVCRRSTIICPIFVVIAACSTSDLATGGAAPRTRMASFGAPWPLWGRRSPTAGLGPKGTIRARGSTRRAARGARGPQWARWLLSKLAKRRSRAVTRVKARCHTSDLAIRCAARNARIRQRRAEESAKSKTKLTIWYY